MRKCFIVLAVAFMVAGLASCGGNGNRDGGNTSGSWNMPQPEQTEIDPTPGKYKFETAVTNSSMSASEFTVSVIDGKKFVSLESQYYHPVVEVVNGSFIIQVGDIAPGTGSYPKEGYAISGCFVSSTKAVGRIKLAIYGIITNDVDFTANLLTESRWQTTPNGNLLEISYKNSSTDIPQYAVIDLNSSYFRMNYGHQSGWGTSVVLLPSFWTGGVLYQGAPISTTLTNEGDNLVVTFTGSISSLTVQGKVTISPPGQNSISATVNANVTGNITLDSRPGEAFKPVLLSSMHISSDLWDTQSAYVGSQFVNIPTSGWIFASPITESTFGLTGGSSSWKTNAPTVEVVFGQDIQVTGWVTSSTKTNDDNVGLWAASDTLLTSWQYIVTAQP